MGLANSYQTPSRLRGNHIEGFHYVLDSWGRADRGSRRSGVAPEDDCCLRRRSVRLRTGLVGLVVE